MTDQFERRLAADLRAYADTRVLPFDAVLVATRSVGNRGRWPRGLALVWVWPRIAWVVVLLGLVLAAGLGAGMGLPVRVPTATATPSPAPSKEDPSLAVLGAGRWTVDWDASGLDGAAYPPLGVIGTYLEFRATSYDFWMGYGGGCYHSTGGYLLDATQLRFADVAPSPDCYTGAGPRDVVAALAQTVSYSISDEPCPSPLAMPQVTQGETCPTLRLRDSVFRVILVLRQIAPLDGTSSGPSPQQASLNPLLVHAHAFG